MEIIINNKSYFFDDVTDVNKRKEIIEEFLATKLKLARGTMTVEEYFYFTWDKQATKTSLDLIGYYLSKMPNQENKVDKEVLSKSQELELTDGTKRTTKKVKDLTRYEIEKLGLSEEDLLNPNKRYHVYVQSGHLHYEDMSYSDKASTGLVEVEELEK